MPSASRLHSNTPDKIVGHTHGCDCACQTRNRGQGCVLSESMRPEVTRDDDDPDKRGGPSERLCAEESHHPADEGTRGARRVRCLGSADLLDG